MEATEQAGREQYAEQLDELYALHLRQRIIDKLASLAGYLADEGYEVSGPHDRTDDEYAWYIAVEGNGLPELVDVTIEVSESVQYDGTTDGIGIGLSIVAYGGEVIGSIQPYNFTAQCWASLADTDEVLRRMGMIERADAQDIADAIAEWASSHDR